MKTFWVTGFSMPKGSLAVYNTHVLCVPGEGRIKLKSFVTSDSYNNLILFAPGRTRKFQIAQMKDPFCEISYQNTSF